ncbi:CLUMA_CG004935, isoform A [Clunio marinus]|uniref:CLUMA_CG004935, isoform A n=1 Tax=Clunio marinus TaxID=568069 RepID=A0A1J1HT73_9DIPT|nr:CLUMA_CG004935, isoform A [Clunio marinus]
MAQNNFSRQVSQFRYRISPGYKYSQLDRNNASRKRIFIAIIIATIIVVGTITAYSIILNKKEDEPKHKELHGAVVANGKECAAIGASILKQQGSVADAAIATMLCEGPQSTGLGGGFLMTIFIKEKNLVECLDAREVAPKAATEDMYVGDKNKSSLEGGLSIAVPGELKGMWELHRKYGKLPWKDVFQPVIDLCKNGHEVTEYLASVLARKNQSIHEIPSLREVFINPHTGQIWNAGDRIKRPALAETMEAIARHGADTMYLMGDVGRQLLDDIKEFGGILSEDDFAEYQVKWLKPVETTLKHGEKLYSMPLTGSGTILIFIMNLLKDFDLKHDVLSYHRIMEAYKLAYARRSELADPAFVENVENLVKNLTSLEYAREIRKKIDDKKTHYEIGYYGSHFATPDDHGTAQISVLAPNGDAISVTGTINYILGSLRRSKTGIILNDEMDDFSTPGLNNIYGIPPSESNYIAPGKRPISSMAPSIILQPDGRVSMVIGSAGGSKITTAIANTIIQYYYMKLNIPLKDMFALKRLHHQLIPNAVIYEDGFDKAIIDGLIAKNHTMKNVTSTIGFAALVGILVEDDVVTGAFDPRRGGSVAIV